MHINVVMHRASACSDDSTTDRVTTHPVRATQNPFRGIDKVSALPDAKAIGTRRLWGCVGNVNDYT